MQSKAADPEEYIASLPEERQKVIKELRKTILKNLPKGFEEGMGYGMLAYFVPHSCYPKGYHADPKSPLPFMNLASQKNFIAFYHMGLYGSPKLLKWFQEEYPKHAKHKLDMGKSCIRFKKIDDIPYKLIGELVTKISLEEWIKNYEANIKR
jgi:uncharacterized protein YdhG (YjbR/CyaY superfamily)